MDFSIERRLLALGIELPKVPRPIANFLPFRRQGALIFLAGQVCELNGEVVYRGKVGREHDLAAGVAAGRLCALNLFASLREACGGSLDTVTACLRVGGFVNCIPDLDKVPAVIDGASNLIRDLMGEHGTHARTAVGVAALPQGATVEVEAVFAADCAPT